MTNEHKTVLEKALVEYQNIQETATKNAKDKLAKDMSEKFDKLLSEEFNKLKNKKESVKESKKDKNNEPINEGKKDADINKEPKKVNENVDFTNSSIDEIENAYDESSEDTDFAVVDDEKFDMSDIEEELSKMESMAEEIDVQQNEVEEDASDPFGKFKKLYEEMTDVINQMENQKKLQEMEQEFNNHMMETFGEGYSNLDENSISSLKEMFMNSKNAAEAPAVNESEEEFVGGEEEAPIEEMHNKVPHGVTAPAEKGHNTSPQGITEEEVVEESHDEEREEDEVVDETAGSAKGHAANRTVGNENMPKSSPRKDSTQRAFQKESVYKDKINKLIAENKKLSKNLNEKRENIAKMEKFISEAKNVIPKYREQLSEMAIFNTNLAYTNNILLDESIALTTEDKKAIINEFKSVKNINESRETYKKLVESYKTTKKPVNESIEDKVVDVIEPSSSQKIVEQVNEKTAFSDDGHLNKIKNMINYHRNK